MGKTRTAATDGLKEPHQSVADDDRGGGRREGAQ